MLLLIVIISDTDFNNGIVRALNSVLCFGYLPYSVHRKANYYRYDNNIQQHLQAEKADLVA